MFEKIFSFLGFNSSRSLVGLAQLDDTNIKTKSSKTNPPSQKEMKISDLMRGA